MYIITTRSGMQNVGASRVAWGDCCRCRGANVGRQPYAPPAGSALAFLLGASTMRHSPPDKPFVLKLKATFPFSGYIISSQWYLLIYLQRLLGFCMWIIHNILFTYHVNIKLIIRCGSALGSINCSFIIFGISRKDRNRMTYKLWDIFGYFCLNHMTKKRKKYAVVTE